MSNTADFNAIIDALSDLYDAIYQGCENEAYDGYDCNRLISLAEAVESKVNLLRDINRTNAE